MSSAVADIRPPKSPLHELRNAAATESSETAVRLAEILKWLNDAFDQLQDHAEPVTSGEAA